MPMHLYDTMSRRLQAVEPLESGHVRLYTCGPTVYARAHIGNFRTFVFEDVMRRWLERRFDRVTHVMNLTDVEDKIIRSAVAHGHGLEEETAPHIAGFFEDLDALGLRRAHHYPRATEYIDAMVAVIQTLTERGVTYTSDGNVYFRIAAFPAYGRLSGLRADNLVAGAGGRVDADEYAKEDVRDFALWKHAAEDEPGWDTALGRGRPGWHIECSAMSMALLGESFDIHCGGVDNIFPHHENEIAQSEAATGKPFVSLWCHSAHLRIGGEKMAKSAGNFSTLHDLLAGDDPVRPSALRYLLAATAHYRKPLTFGADVVHMSIESVDRIAAFRDRLAILVGDAGGAAGVDGEIAEIVTRGLGGFEQSMDADLNLPEAMGFVHTAIRDANRALDGGAPSAAGIDSLTSFLLEVDDVVGVLDLVDRERTQGLGAEEQGWLDAREAARASRDWGASDSLRDQLRSRGIVVEDTPQGQRWHRAG